MLHALTVATKEERGLQAFQATAIRHGVAVTVLGWGMEWRGLTMKLKLVQQWLRDVPGEDLIVFADGYDCVWADGLEGLKRRFRALGHPLVMSAERNCYPFADRAGDYPPCETPYRYLNCGCWMGRAGHMRHLLAEMRIEQMPDDFDDQALFTIFYLSNFDAIRLDTRQEMFQSLYQAEGDIVLETTTEGERIARNQLTNTYPAIVHGNGHADMREVTDWLQGKTAVSVQRVL